MSEGLLGQIFNLGSSIVQDIAKSRKDNYEALDLVRNDSYKSYEGRGLGTGNALLFDPNLWGFSSVVFREKPYALNYYVLNQLGERDPIIAAIVLNRLNQISTFTSPKSRHEAQRTIGTGFRVQMKSGNNKKRTKAVDSKEDYLSKILFSCASEDCPIEERVDKCFDTFLRKFAQDRLILDQSVAMVEFDAKNSIKQFYAVDGSTFRLTAFGSELYKQFGPYVQVWNGMVINAFRDENIIWGAQNVTTQLARFGYGRSELEYIVRLMMAHLGIDASNEKMFNPSSIPKGFITIEGGEISEENMKQLELSIANQMTSSRSRHRIPILAGPKGQKVVFQHLPQANDLEFKAFIDYFVNIAAAIYQMDPLEINFPNRGGPGQKGTAIGGSSDWEARLTASKDRGLKSLLAWLSRIINIELIPQLDRDGEFEFTFVGFDAKSDKERTDLAKEQSSMIKTIDEVREEFGLDPLPDGMGKIVLSQIYTSRLQVVEQQKQMEEQQKQQEQMRQEISSDQSVVGREKDVDNDRNPDQNGDQEGVLWKDWAQAPGDQGW